MKFHAPLFALIASLALTGPGFSARQKRPNAPYIPPSEKTLADNAEILKAIQAYTVPKWFYDLNRVHGHTRLPAVRVSPRSTNPMFPDYAHGELNSPAFK